MTGFGFLAETNVGPTEIGNLVLGLIQLLTLWKLTQRKPPIEAEFSTKKEMAEFAKENKGDHDGIFSKIGGVERASTRAILELSTTVAALDERTETTNATLVEQSRKIDLILTRLPHS